MSLPVPPNPAPGSLARVRMLLDAASELSTVAHEVEMEEMESRASELAAAQELAHELATCYERLELPVVHATCDNPEHGAMSFARSLFHGNPPRYVQVAMKLLCGHASMENGKRRYRFGVALHPNGTLYGLGGKRATFQQNGSGLRFATARPPREEEISIFYDGEGQLPGAPLSAPLCERIGIDTPQVVTALETALRRVVEDLDRRSQKVRERGR